MIPRLLAISPGTGTRDFVRLVQEGPFDAVLVREPGLTEADVEALVHDLAEIVPTVLVHERSPGAYTLAGQGFGLHLTDRPCAGPDRASLLGVSCHDAAGVDARFAEGADYVLLSPVWVPTSKPDDTRRPLGLTRFLAIAADRPVLALGGVTPARYAELRGAGGYGAAVLGGLTAFATPPPVHPKG